MFPTSDSLINVHSHFRKKIPSEFAIRNAFLKHDNSKLSKIEYPVSIGLHPWHIDEMTIEECEEKLLQLVSLDNVFAIGETGIDRSIETDLKKQYSFFEAQLTIAETINKPVIVHAVKSYSDMIPYLKRSTVPFIFHAYNGNKIQAKELLKYNCKLSFGKNIFGHKSDDILRILPDGTFFLETDTANHITISDVYDKAAEIRKTKTTLLKEQLFHTFAQIFSK